MNDGARFILVTGGAGFIGSHTVVELFNEGYTPIVLDDFRNAHRDVIQRLEELTGKPVLYFDYSCQETDKVRGIFEKYPIEGVIHFAAYKAVAESIDKPLEYIRNNIDSLLSVLQLTSAFDVQNIVFSSSCTVYGAPKQIPVNESMPTTFITPYGFSKKSGEDVLQQYVVKYPTTKVTMLRYFNPIGAHESGLIGEEPGGKPNNLLPYITQTAIGLRKELTIFGDDYPTKDGTCVRDYIHVVDIAKAHVEALKKAALVENPAVYNVGLGKGTSVLEIVQTFEKISGKKLAYHFGERREGDIPEIYANADKIQKELGWQPTRTIEEAIQSAWEFEQLIRTKRK